MKKTVLLLLALCILLIGATAETSGSSMQLLVINVRKADCMLLSCGDDVYMIDTGSVQSWGQVSSMLKYYGIDHLTGVIVTHTDKDHAGGLEALSTSSIAVDGWYASAYFEGVKAKKHPATLAAAVRGEQVHWLKSGDILPLGEGQLRVLGPISESDTENCNSLVMLAQGSGTILLTGDMEFPEEEELMAAACFTQCTVLKIPHHGESDATGEGLIRMTKPQLAVISTNTNDEPDTPSSRVMNLLSKYRILVTLTQNSGDGILITVDDDTAISEYVELGELPEQAQGLKLADKDTGNQSIRVTNQGSQEVDLSGYYIQSDNGNEIYVFPDGTTLAPGASLTVSCRDSKTPGDLVWPQDKVWSKKKNDAAILYDVWGREIDRLD